MVTKIKDNHAPKYSSFIEWNKQFNDQHGLDEYIEEYQISLRTFRFSIYQSEQEQGMSKLEFLEKLKSLK